MRIAIAGATDTGGPGHCFTTSRSKIQHPKMRLSLPRLVCDAIDLDLHLRHGELRLDGGPSRLLIAEKLGVDFVHRREILAVAEEHGALYHVGHARAAAF